MLRRDIRFCKGFTIVFLMYRSVGTTMPWDILELPCVDSIWRCSRNASQQRWYHSLIGSLIIISELISEWYCLCWVAFPTDLHVEFTQVDSRISQDCLILGTPKPNLRTITAGKMSIALPNCSMRDKAASNVVNQLASSGIHAWIFPTSTIVATRVAKASKQLSCSNLSGRQNPHVSEKSSAESIPHPKHWLLGK